jgi:peptidoglycan/LPS O-acetylase OafA/YrhL
MQINIVDPYFQTLLFITFLTAFILLTVKKDTDQYKMNHSHTDELKGVAILMVIFSHVGYFLVTDHRFLFPLSVAGGVGVNIFLFLSGFGLTESENASSKSVLSFYLKRLKKLFIPMWVVLILTLVLDFYLLGKTYGRTTIVQNLLGFFPTADIFNANNSPLWYFSIILFYYLIFPLVYKKKRQLLSIGVIFLLGYIAVNTKLPVPDSVLKLYKLHYLAFPLGMFFAYIQTKKPVVKLEFLARYFLILVSSLLFCYTAINSNVGGKLIAEQLTSLVTVASLIIVFLLKKFQSSLLLTLGKYSYEIYLIHWPLMYRYDFIFKHTTAFLGTLIYIFILIVIGFVLNKIVELTSSSNSKNT